MAEKITKRTNITEMLNDEYIKNHENWYAYLQNEMELLDNRNANRKPTKTQKENIELAEKVYEALDTPKSPSQLVAEGLATSTQKITPILNKLVEEGRVEHIKEGKKNLYSRVAPTVE